jgi:hypothetical protein
VITDHAIVLSMIMLSFIFCDHWPYYCTFYVYVVIQFCDVITKLNDNINIESTIVWSVITKYEWQHNHRKYNSMVSDHKNEWQQKHRKYNSMVSDLVLSMFMLSFNFVITDHAIVLSMFMLSFIFVITDHAIVLSMFILSFNL